MSFIDFRAEYKVHIRSIDHDHELIAGIVNSIYEAMLNADKILAISEMNKLLQVLGNHFENEERLMKENQFPGYFSHKLEHDRFYKQILTTIDRSGREEGVLGSKELQGIRRWFFNHIEINDSKCGQFLSDKGIS